jgi:hypothetical protein
MMKNTDEEYKRQVLAARDKYKVDDNYHALVTKIKPEKDYYHFSQGDKLLFFERVDKLKYDIFEEYKLRKEKQERE